MHSHSGSKIMDVNPESWAHQHFTTCIHTKAKGKHHQQAAKVLLIIIFAHYSNDSLLLKEKKKAVGEKKKKALFLAWKLLISRVQIINHSQR